MRGDKQGARREERTRACIKSINNLSAGGDEEAGAARLHDRCHDEMLAVRLATENGARGKKPPACAAAEFRLPHESTSVRAQGRLGESAMPLFDYTCANSEGEAGNQRARQMQKVIFRIGEWKFL